MSSTPERSIPNHSRHWQVASDVAGVLLAVIAAFWALWGSGELYFEGWWGQWPYRLMYLIPGAGFTLLALLAVFRERLTGWALILLGGAFTAFYLSVNIPRWGLSLRSLIGILPVTGFAALLGIVLVLAASRRPPTGDDGELAVETAAKQRAAPGPLTRARRNWRPLLAVSLPIIVAVVVSALNLPTILTRVDDGDRGAQLIEGNGVSLVWAPAGPGWGRGLQHMGQPDAQQPGGVLSWNDLALYGVPPVGTDDKPGRNDLECGTRSDAGCAAADDMEATGLCRYLDADGTRLLTEPPGIWRMPTADEIARSLARHGENSGCAWDGEAAHAGCARTPDKEPPLWDPATSAVYYWAADESDRVNAYYVNYNGNAVSDQPKSFGNPRHGYRCVREP